MRSQTFSNRLTGALAALGCLAALTMPAVAADDHATVDRDPPGVFTGNAAAGETIAKDNCARCHAVERTGESPVADATPFRLMSRLWPLSHLEEALAEGIMVGHPEHQMPVFQFTPQEIDDLLTYIESIQVSRQEDPDWAGAMEP